MPRLCMNINFTQNILMDKKQLHTGHSLTGLAMHFAMQFVHDRNSKLSGVATFSIVMCHRVAL